MKCLHHAPNSSRKQECETVLASHHVPVLFIRWCKNESHCTINSHLRPCHSCGRSVVHMSRLKEHNARGKWSLILLSAAAPRNPAKTRIGRCGSSARSPAQLRLSDKAHRNLRCIDVLRRPSTWQHALSLYVFPYLYNCLRH